MLLEQFLYNCKNSRYWFNNCLKDFKLEQKFLVFSLRYFISWIPPKPEVFTKKLPMVTTKGILVKNIIIFVWKPSKKNIFLEQLFANVLWIVKYDVIQLTIVETIWN